MGMKNRKLPTKKRRSKIKDVLSGKIRITNRLKFHMLIGSIVSIHVFLLVIFLIFRVYPLFCFNIFSILVYVFCFWLMSGEREHYLAIYYITYVEIIMHSLAAVICLGWNFGFTQYILAIIPVDFYICYTLDIKQRKFTLATLSGILSAVAFGVCKFISVVREPLIILDNAALELSLYVFNSLCVFSFLLTFSLIFVYEIRLSSEQLKRQNAALVKLANTDPLTGLYNRRSMDFFLSQAVETKTHFALIMCDIDNFKSVNDTYGHDFGDVVLKGIAQIAVEHVKGHGCVCRWGGEELLILLINVSDESSFRIAENIRRNVANRVFELNEKWIRCSLTLGIALHNEKESAEDTITRADYNLYCGKRNGKNVVICSQ